MGAILFPGSVRDADYLAAIPTRLEPALQSKLMNWGYAVCDAAVRAHVKPADFGIDIGAPRVPFPGEY